MPKFRYSLDTGITWVTVDAALPYNIPCTFSDEVIVESLGEIIPFERNLISLTLSANTVQENSSAGTMVAAVLNKLPGSTLTLTNNAGGRFALSGNDIVTGSVSFDYETATSHSITIRETFAGSLNSPRDTTLVINVINIFEQPNLTTLTLSSPTATSGINSTISIIGATAGSTITGSVPDGMTLNSASRTISGTPTIAGTYDFSLTETLVDSANSPFVSTVTITVEAAPAAATPTMTNSVTYEGITYSFYDAPTGGSLKTVAVYTGAEGQPNIVADPTTYMETNVPSVQFPTTATGASRYNANGTSTNIALSSTPLWGNGMQKNPMLFDGTYLGVGLAQGLDESLAYYDANSAGGPSSASRSVWDASINIDPGYTGTRVQMVEGSYVKTKRSSTFGTTLDNYYTFETISVLHVLPAAPPVGFFSPAIPKTDKTPSFFVSQRDKTSLGSGFGLPSGKVSLTDAEGFEATINTNGTTSISVTATQGLITASMVGQGEKKQTIRGPGIPHGAYIVSGPTGGGVGTYIISQPATSTATGVSCSIGGYFNRGIQPYFGQNGERRRRFMINDVDRTGIGYSRDYGQNWNDWLTGLLALGSSAPDNSLNRALSFGQNMIGLYDQANFLGEGGAGQSNGHKQFVQLLGHVFNTSSGLHAKCIAFLGNFVIQPKKISSGDVGLPVGFPDGNHEVFYRPWGEEHIGQYGWTDGGISSSEFDQDYETTSSIASFGEFLNAGSMKNWPGGLDGSQVLEANYPGTIGYYDLIRTVPKIYPTSPSNVRDDNFYDAIRSTWTIGIKAQRPNSASFVSGVTAGESSFTWDYSTMGHSPETVIDAETQYSMDGIIWSSSFSGITAGPVSGLVPGWRYYTRRRRRSASGWGPWSYNVISSNQSITAKASGTTTVGSRTITLTISAGSPAVRVGDLVAGPGITPGSYIASFGTGTGVAGNTGTYNLSMPAHEAVTSQQFRMVPMPAMVTPTGTPSGTVVWTTNPAIYRSTYSTNPRTPLFSPVISESEIPQGSYIYCGMGIATGAVQAPTFQWKRDGVNISGATGQGYQRVSADAGKTLTCTVTSNGQSATTAGISIAPPTYPTSFDQVTFDGSTTYLARTTPAVLTGASDSQQITMAVPIQMLSGDGVLKRIVAWGDASGTSSTDNIIAVDRTAGNLIQVQMRAATSGTLVFNVVCSSGTLNTAAGEQLLMISLDLATASYQIYLGDTACTLGTVTGSLAAVGLSIVQRPQFMTALSGLGTSTVNAKLRYLFVHPAKIDLSVKANRDKFAASASGIGDGGTGPFGTTPLFFMHGTTADWNAGTNWGSGGNVNMIGAVT